MLGFFHNPKPVKLIGIVVFIMFLAFSAGWGLVSMAQGYDTYAATKQAQRYMDARAAKADLDGNITVKVSNCAWVPTKNESIKPNLVCKVLILAGDESDVEILQFTPDNLSGKSGPPVMKRPEFDHDKDTNI